ncbi:methyl-accepting chemotaxis protein [Aneurinibacillus terranovensis]|uniref:methyl-accepting chemotaxis protein n=1 Tax=Aneurinibacillus terranovensis TaxID=278991 RepID=UPI0004126DD0|nr:methyl-accepting chemotaxis protein [Aneurinibacillus terranovensis]
MSFFKVNHSIVRKISAGLIIPCAIFSILFSGIIYQTSMYLVNNQVIPGLENLLKARMEGLDRIVGPIMVKGAMENEAQYEQLVSILTNYQKRTGVENVYVIARDNNKPFIVALSNSKEHMTGYSLTPEMAATFNDSAHISGIYQNRLGIHKSIFSPVSGCEAIIGIDIDASFVMNLKRMILLGSVLLILLTISIGWFVAHMIAKKITGPLILLARHANQLAAGDLTNEITTNNKDEIGILAESFEAMRQKLGRVVHQLVQSSSLVGETSHTILDASQYVLDGSRQIAIATKQVAGSQEHQFGYVKEVSTMFTGTSEAITHVNEKINDMAAGSLQAKNLSQQGNDQVKIISQQMEEIIRRGKETSAELNHLGMRSQEIATVVNIIKKIASQINLLALNASIEASRAGEAGRGFAVVAQEIRNLAEQTNQSVSTIIESVDAIRKASDAVTDKNKKSFSEILKGAELIKQNGEIFEAIYLGVSGLADGTSDVAKEAEGITERTNQALAAIQQIAAISQQEVAAIQEISASASQQDASVNRLKRLSMDLTGLYKELEATFAIFKVENN